MGFTLRDVCLQPALPDVHHGRSGRAIPVGPLKAIEVDKDQPPDTQAR